MVNVCEDSGLGVVLGAVIKVVGVSVEALVVLEVRTEEVLGVNVRVCIIVVATIVFCVGEAKFGIVWHIEYAPFTAAARFGRNQVLAYHSLEPARRGF